MPPAMVCSSCSTPLPEAAAFCWVCGTPTPTGVTPSGGTQTRPSLESPIAVLDTQRRLARALGANFRVDGLVGRGGFAEVFAVHDLRLKRDLAVKVLSPELVPNQTMLTRFRREAEAIAALRHPGIVPIYDIGEAGGIAYIVMPLIKGMTLRKKIDDAGRLPLREARRVLREVSDALRVAHEAGLVHRDIKPENVMLDGPREQVLVMDFGIAKAVDPNATGVTTAGLIVGTPHYMSPEQASGEMVDARSDQYSLAVLGYRMVTGTHPFEAETTRALLYKQVFESPAPARERVADIPESLSAALQRGMAKEPAERYPTIEEFAAAIMATEGDSGPRAAVGHTRATPAIGTPVRQRTPAELEAKAREAAAAAAAAQAAEAAAGSGTATGAGKAGASSGSVSGASGAVAGADAAVQPGTAKARVTRKKGGFGKVVLSLATTGAVVAGLFWAKGAAFDGQTPDPAVVAGGDSAAMAAGATGTDGAPAGVAAPGAAPRSGASRTTGRETSAGSDRSGAGGGADAAPRAPTRAATYAGCAEAVRASAWEAAAGLCRAEAERGNADAQLALAGMYQAGQGVAADPAAAAVLYEQAVAAGSADAAFRLGQMLEGGHGIPADLVRANQLYMTAARRGVVPAMRSLAAMLEAGRGAPKNETEAVNWYRRAASANDGPSILRIGQLYSRGIGVGRDDAIAFRYFMRGAEAGMAEAQLEVARAFLAGRGVQRSDSLGVVWLERAAARGSEAAADELRKWKP